MSARASWCKIRQYCAIRAAKMRLTQLVQAAINNINQSTIEGPRCFRFQSGASLLWDEKKTGHQHQDAVVLLERQIEWRSLASHHNTGACSDRFQPFVRKRQYAQIPHTANIFSIWISASLIFVFGLCCSTLHRSLKHVNWSVTAWLTPGKIAVRSCEKYFVPANCNLPQLQCWVWRLEARRTFPLQLCQHKVAATALSSFRIETKAPWSPQNWPYQAAKVLALCLHPVCNRHIIQGCELKKTKM